MLMMIYDIMMPNKTWPTWPMLFTVSLYLGMAHLHWLKPNRGKKKKNLNFESFTPVANLFKNHWGLLAIETFLLTYFLTCCLYSNRKLGITNVFPAFLLIDLLLFVHSIMYFFLGGVKGTFTCFNPLKTSPEYTRAVVYGKCFLYPNQIIFNGLSFQVFFQNKQLYDRSCIKMLWECSRLYKTMCSRVTPVLVDRGAKYPPHFPSALHTSWEAVRQ